MTFTYYILEHPTRGTLMELDSELKAGGRFSWSGKRTDEGVMRFRSVQSAMNARAHLDLKIQREAKVRKAPEFEVVA